MRRYAVQKSTVVSNEDWLTVSMSSTESEATEQVLDVIRRDIFNPVIYRVVYISDERQAEILGLDQERRYILSRIKGLDDDREQMCCRCKDLLDKADELGRQVNE